MDEVSGRSEQLITPRKEGGKQKSVQVRSDNFLPPKPGEGHWKNKDRKKPYLILGFDTEYQSPPPIARGDTDVIKQGWGKYEVLSYQFCCSIIYPDKDDEVEWSGIIIPKRGKEKDRISLGDFVVFALGSGIKKFPDIKIPTSIYLTAHFTRADIPAFNDFCSKGGRRSLNLSNLRNTFVNTCARNTALPRLRLWTFW